MATGPNPIIILTEAHHGNFSYFVLKSKFHGNACRLPYKKPAKTKRTQIDTTKGAHRWDSGGQSEVYVLSSPPYSSQNPEGGFSLNKAAAHFQRSTSIGFRIAIHEG